MIRCPYTMLHLVVEETLCIASSILVGTSGPAAAMYACDGLGPRMLREDDWAYCKLIWPSRSIRGVWVGRDGPRNPRPCSIMGRLLQRALLMLPGATTTSTGTTATSPHHHQTCRHRQERHCGIFHPYLL